jgi:hypothetical protein
MASSSHDGIGAMERKGHGSSGIGFATTWMKWKFQSPVSRRHWCNGKKVAEFTEPIRLFRDDIGEMESKRSDNYFSFIRSFATTLVKWKAWHPANLFDPKE